MCLCQGTPKPLQAGSSLRDWVLGSEAGFSKSDFTRHLLAPRLQLERRLVAELGPRRLVPRGVGVGWGEEPDGCWVDQWTQG